MTYKELQIIRAIAERLNQNEYSVYIDGLNKLKRDNKKKLEKIQLEVSKILEIQEELNKNNIEKIRD